MFAVGVVAPGTGIGAPPDGHGGGNGKDAPGKGKPPAVPADSGSAPADPTPGRSDSPPARDDKPADGGSGTPPPATPAPTAPPSSATPDGRQKGPGTGPNRSRPTGTPGTAPAPGRTSKRFTTYVFRGIAVANGRPGYVDALLVKGENLAGNATLGTNPERVRIMISPQTKITGPRSGAGFRALVKGSRLIATFKAPSGVVVDDLPAAHTIAAPAARVASQGDVTPKQWNSTYDWAAGHGYSGWFSKTATPDVGRYGIATGHGGVPGLWIWLKGGGRYGPGYVEWVYRAPGRTRLLTSELTLGSTDKLFSHHCVEVGLRDAEGVRALKRYCSPPDPNAEATAGVPMHDEHQVTVNLRDPADVPLATELFVRVVFPDCKNAKSPGCRKYVPRHDPLVNGAMVRVPTVKMQLVDDDLPEVVASGPFRDLADRYIDGTKSYPLAVAASDAGSGLRSIGATEVDGPSLGQTAVSCDPTHSTPPLGARICPPTLSDSYLVDTTLLPEGPHRFTGSATDVADLSSTSEPWTVTVDRTPPVNITASGPLAERKGGYFPGTGTETINVGADDALSGVRRIELHDQTAATLLGAADIACEPKQCPRTGAAGAISVDLGVLAEGAHEFELVTVDLVGNTARSAAWKILVDRTAPPAPSQAILADFDGMTASVQWSQETTDPALGDGSPGSGFAGLEFRYLSHATDAWTEWAPVTGGLVTEIPAEENRVLQVEGRSRDNVANISAVLQASISIPNLDACNPTQVALPEHTGLVEGAGHLIRPFQFTQAIDQATFLAMLPAGASVVTLVARTPLSDGSVISDDAVVGSSSTVTDALALMNQGAINTQAGLVEGIRGDLAELPAGPSTARTYIQGQLNAYLKQGVALARDGGPRIRSFSVSPNPAAEAAVRRAFDGMLMPVPADFPAIPASCGVDAAGAASSSSAGATGSADIAGAAATSMNDAEDSDGIEEQSVRGTHSPAYADVKGKHLTGNGHYLNWVSVEWTWGHASNFSYWYTGHRMKRVGDIRRGFEIEVLLDVDTNGSFGRPAYRGPTPIVGGSPIPVHSEAASTNMLPICRYAEDYQKLVNNTVGLEDIDGQYTLTVGSKCRPTKPLKRWFWTQYLELDTGKVTDEAIVQVQAVHSVYTSELLRLYCVAQGGREMAIASCMFHDRGVSTPRLAFTRDGDDKIARLPTGDSAIRLYRNLTKDED
jgi:hypothetical protein